MKILKHSYQYKKDYKLKSYHDKKTRHHKPNPSALISILQ